MAHAFVPRVPERLEAGTLYVSIETTTMVHLCACGCGREVVTPLSPVGWQVTFDGETVSLHPSIGNWDFPCRSHYWIDRGRVLRARSWDHEEVAEHDASEARARVAYFANRPREEPPPAPGHAGGAEPPLVQGELSSARDQDR